jgi:hypothetical protein
MQSVKGKLLRTQYAPRQGARAKGREVALGGPGFEPGRISASLSLRLSRGHMIGLRSDITLIKPLSDLSADPVKTRRKQ